MSTRPPGVKSLPVSVALTWPTSCRLTISGSTRIVGVWIWGAVGLGPVCVTRIAQYSVRVVLRLWRVMASYAVSTRAGGSIWVLV